LETEREEKNPDDPLQGKQFTNEEPFLILEKKNRQQ
jgi:hypothetical protein